MAGVNLAKSFNPWQSLAAHEPIGVINRVRKLIYNWPGFVPRRILEGNKDNIADRDG